MKVKYIGSNLYGKSLKDRILVKNNTYDVIGKIRKNYFVMDERNKKCPVGIQNTVKVLTENKNPY